MPQAASVLSQWFVTDVAEWVRQVEPPGPGVGTSVAFFGDGTLDANRVILHMPRYSTRQRAQILYNHIYFSDLPDAHIVALLEGDFYHEIIHHERLNPRTAVPLSPRELHRQLG